MSRSVLPFDYFPGIFPECMEQTDRVNIWKGGETQGLSNLKKRIDIEEVVRKVIPPHQIGISVVFTHVR